MKFVANENFPLPAYEYLIKEGFDVIHIGRLFPGISDLEVLNLAIREDRIIITFDSDYGEMVFKYNIKPESGIIYFRIYNYSPTEPGEYLSEIIKTKSLIFKSRITVIDRISIRQKKY